MYQRRINDACYIIGIWLSARYNTACHFMYICHKRKTSIGSTALRECLLHLIASVGVGVWIQIMHPWHDHEPRPAHIIWGGIHPTSSIRVFVSQTRPRLSAPTLDIINYMKCFFFLASWSRKESMSPRTNLYQSFALAILAKNLILKRGFGANRIHRWFEGTNHTIIPNLTPSFWNDTVHLHKCYLHIDMSVPNSGWEFPHVLICLIALLQNVQMFHFWQWREWYCGIEYSEIHFNDDCQNSSPLKNKYILYTCENASNYMEHMLYWRKKRRSIVYLSLVTNSRNILFVFERKTGNHWPRALNSCSVFSKHC